MVKLVMTDGYASQLEEPLEGRGIKYQVWDHLILTANLQSYFTTSFVCLSTNHASL